LVALAGTQIPRIIIDTDPENMLPEDQQDRVFHDETRHAFSLYEMIVVGVVNEVDSEGVFNPGSLSRIHRLTRAIEKIEGVVREDLLSLASVDNISQEGPGVIRFEWMMKEAPTGAEGALAIRDAARRLPMLDGTVISEDGRAAAIYVPIREKTESYRIASEIESILQDFEGNEDYHITGLPVAEDTFGVEMFVQMAISAPLAGLVIFLLLWVFFRSLVLITSPMILAMATVIITMGVLIGAGFPVHIMSSMIPIFLMPIAVVDSVHILSEFADLYPEERDSNATIRKVMGHLLTPMLYTSLTSAAGFASLMLTPIPPVRVFGAFVAFGILLAFVLTVLFIPAFAVSIDPKRLASLKAASAAGGHGFLARSVRSLGGVSRSFAKPLIVGFVLILALSAYGISTIRINDNPVRWFHQDHRIRLADRILNEHFGGTYMAYLVLEQTGDEKVRTSLGKKTDEILRVASQDGVDLAQRWQALRAEAANPSFSDELMALADAIEGARDQAQGDAIWHWEDLLAAVEDAESEARYFQGPEALRLLEGLQTDLAESGLVGKSNSLVEIVKTVYRELRGEDESFDEMPSSGAGVAQTLLSYQSSHRPGDLWHLVTPDYRRANIWLQLRSGDNQDMEQVERRVARYLEENPLPDGVVSRWAGLTYINVVWQEAMVAGMLKSLLGSFVIVFAMMVFLFRSVAFGFLAMIPLTLTIAFIYGVIGLIGKDYDMPVAVLSALTLGLSIDFAIHFLQRARQVHEDTGSLSETLDLLFEEPGRAIARNSVVVAVGFLPLLAAPLVPYNTVGFFMAAIMAISSLVTLLVLPSALRLFQGTLLGAVSKGEDS